MRKTLAQVVLFCLVAGGIPATAQIAPGETPTHGDNEIMEACLETQINPVAVTDLAYLTCVRRAALKCMEAPDGGTTLGITDCFERETGWWDARLNQTYKLLQENLSNEEFSKLKEVQRAWMAFRDAQCRFTYDFYAPGSIRQTYTAACYLRETARRAIDLHMFAFQQELASP